MDDIILINTPPWGVVMPPLGIAYLAAYLKSNGLNASVYDLNLELYKKADDKGRELWGLAAINKIAPQDIAEGILNLFPDKCEELVDKVKNWGVIGFSANNLISTLFAGLLGERIKKRYKDKIVILGGPGCYHSWDRAAVPKGAVDFFVIGEGEEALTELLNRLKKNNEKAELKIPGVLQVNENGKENFTPRGYVKDLKKIPYPNFEEFDFSSYGTNGYHPLPMLMSRGCINQCSYCIDCHLSSPFRMRAPEDIVSEMKHHKEKFGITHVEFNDLLCNGNLFQLERLCEQLIEADLGIQWISYAAIRKNISRGLLEKMKRSGCSSLCYGLESGSDTVLKLMNKHYNSYQAAEVLRMTHEAGINAGINIIVGFPGETEGEFLKTLDFIRENKDYISQVTNVSSFVLMPGSDVGVYPHKFKIKFLDPGDPGKWTDCNGLTQEQRNKRVSRTCRLLGELKIRNLIVNIQEQACAEDDYETSAAKKNDAAAEPVVLRDVNSGKITLIKSYSRSHMFRKTVILCGLVLFSIIADLYLMLLKKVRGSIIFPGN